MSINQFEVDNNMFGDEEDDELFACISTQALEQNQALPNSASENPPGKAYPQSTSQNKPGQALPDTASENPPGKAYPQSASRNPPGQAYPKSTSINPPPVQLPYWKSTVQKPETSAKRKSKPDLNHANQPKVDEIFKRKRHNPHHAAPGPFHTVETKLYTAITGPSNPSVGAWVEPLETTSAGSSRTDTLSHGKGLEPFNIRDYVEVAAKGVPRKKTIFIDGAPESIYAKHNTMSQKKNLGLEFVRKFSESVDAYIVDWKTPNSNDILKTAYYYQCLGLGIPVLSGAYIRWLEHGGKKQDELDYEVMVPTAPRIARTRKEKLFAGFNFFFVTTASFTGYKFTKMEVMDILRLSGGTVQLVAWTDFGKAFKDFQKRKALLESGGPGKRNVVVVCRMEWNHPRFNAIYHKLGVESINVSYFFKCLDEQNLIELTNNFKCYKKEVVPPPNTV